MRAASTLLPIFSCLAVGGSSQLLPVLSNLRQTNPPPPAGKAQSPFMDQTPNIALPGSGGSSSDQDPASDILISDVVGRSQTINIFAGFTRDIPSISSRLDSSGSNSTILAPLNAEIYKLPRKPWEDPADYERLGAQAYDGQQGADKADENLKRFVEAHIMPESPWPEGRKLETLAGRELWWESGAGGKKLIQPNGIEVESIADKVANGEVWILKGVLNYASK